MLLAILLASMLMSCKTQTTGGPRLDPVVEGITSKPASELPNKFICGDRNGGGPYRPLSYASDGQPGQLAGEDTDETIAEIRSHNARQKAYCTKR